MRYQTIIHDSNELFYDVYEDGRVYSHHSKRFMNPVLTSGYLMLGSRLGTVHRLVAMCFIGSIPSDMVVNHIDGNKCNNHYSNLEIVTVSENVKHAQRHGLMKPMSGEKNGMSKLSNKCILDVVKSLLNNETNEEIGIKFNLHPRYVSLIRHGKRWKDIYNEYGPFPMSRKDNSEIVNKYNSFLVLKDTKNNKEIANLLNVDPSTISRWRNGKTRN